MIQYSTKAPFKCFDGFFTNGPQPYVNSFVIIFKTIKRSQNIHFDGDLVERKYWFDCRYSTMRAMDFKFFEKKDDRFIITRIEFKPPSSISPYSLFLYKQNSRLFIMNYAKTWHTYACIWHLVLNCFDLR